MPDEVIVRFASPTLEGIKTGSLFSYAYQTQEALLQEVKRRNAALSKKGLRLLVLRCAKGRALLYLFRPARLAQDLSQQEARSILQGAGYPDGTSAVCLGELVRRLKTQEEFPHEIGLFLSYPPKDVAGFIRHGGKCSKCSGCWQVYGDEAAAKRQFEQFKQCTEKCRRRLENGWRVEDLAVAD